MALNTRERNLLIITVSAVVLGLNYLLVAPLFGKWSALQTRLSSKRRELEGIQATVARAPEWRKSYDDLGKNLKQSQTFDTASDVLKKIEEVGGAAGILIQSRRMLRVDSKDVYRELPVQCTFEATIESLVKFLHGVQTASGFMTVESLGVTAKPDNTSILRCDIQIRALAAATGKPTS
jgi:Tfp pilus assembly protein PilO